MGCPLVRTALTRQSPRPRPLVRTALIRQKPSLSFDSSARLCPDKAFVPIRSFARLWHGKAFALVRSSARLWPDKAFALVRSSVRLWPDKAFVLVRSFARLWHGKAFVPVRYVRTARGPSKALAFPRPRHSCKVQRSQKPGRHPPRLIQHIVITDDVDLPNMTLLQGTTQSTQRLAVTDCSTTATTGSRTTRCTSQKPGWYTPG